jgi:hypothetical protein
MRYYLGTEFRTALDEDVERFEISGTYFARDASVLQIGTKVRQKITCGHKRVALTHSLSGRSRPLGFGSATWVCH